MLHRETVSKNKIQFKKYLLCLIEFGNVLLLSYLEQFTISYQVEYHEFYYLNKAYVLNFKTYVLNIYYLNKAYVLNFKTYVLNIKKL
jgi:hypothetical protein